MFHFGLFRLGVLALVLSAACGKSPAGSQVPTAPSESPTAPVDPVPVAPKVVLQSPVPVTPDFSPQPARPSLTVVNVERSGPVGVLSYELEIATASSFETLILAATTPEGQERTTFMSTTGLTRGIVYYWRSRARDMASGVTSAYSAIGRFFTTFADDGTHPASLQVHLADACRHSGPWMYRDFQATGTLVVTGTTAQFSTSNPGFLTLIGPRLGLTLRQTGAQLAGEAVGKSRDSWITNNYFEFQLSGPAVVSGAVEGNGLLTGSFDGTLELGGYDNFGTCRASGFGWTLRFD